MRRTGTGTVTLTSAGEITVSVPVPPPRAWPPPCAGPEPGQSHLRRRVPQTPPTARAAAAEKVLTAAWDDGIVVVVVMKWPPFTVREYLNTPEAMFPQELVYGHVREAPGPAVSHQTVVGNLYTVLRSHLRDTGIGRVWMSPIDVVLDPARALVVQPDLIVVLNEQLHHVTDRVWLAPDLVIEVLSPRPRIGELAERLGWFARYGVRECWLVRQLEGDVEVISFSGGDVIGHRIAAEDERIDSSVLPGLHCTVGDALRPW